MEKKEVQRLLTDVREPDHSQAEKLPLQRIARESALQFLYELDVQKESPTPEALEAFWTHMVVERYDFNSIEWDKIKAAAAIIIDGVCEHRDVIDEQIRGAAMNWEFDRILITDRNVMRIAVYEILFRDDIPVAVSLNEAVDIAKDFSGEGSGSFVNGVVDKIAKTVGEAQ